MHHIPLLTSLAFLIEPLGKTSLPTWRIARGHLFVFDSLTDWQLTWPISGQKETVEHWRRPGTSGVITFYLAENRAIDGLMRRDPRQKKRVAWGMQT